MICKKYLELWQVRREGNLSALGARKVFDNRIRSLAHVVGPDLLERLFLILGSSFQFKLGAENVAQLGSVTVTTTGNLLLLIVVVG